MSDLKTIRCPACGKKKLLKSPCSCGGKARKKAGHSRTSGWIAFLLTLTGTTVGLIAIAALIDSSGHGLLSIIVVAGIFGLMTLFRLGYDFEDGISVQNFMLPGPLDWGEKIESFRNFFEMDRPYFRAIYLGSMLAMIIWFIIYSTND